MFPKNNNNTTKFKLIDRDYSPVKIYKLRVFERNYVEAKLKLCEIRFGFFIYEKNLLFGSKFLI